MTSWLRKFLMIMSVQKGKELDYSDTPKRADVSAMFYTMVEIAKGHNLNIYT